jgi:hypothetical protein
MSNIDFPDGSAQELLDFYARFTAAATQAHFANETWRPDPSQ